MGPALLATDNVLSADAAANPAMAGWNHVFLRYCSGDTYVGADAAATPAAGACASPAARTSPRPSTTSPRARARPRAPRVLAGASAGGIGVNNACDWFVDRLAAAGAGAPAPASTRAARRGRGSSSRAHTRALWRARGRPERPEREPGRRALVVPACSARPRSRELRARARAARAPTRAASPTAGTPRTGCRRRRAAAARAELLGRAAARRHPLPRATARGARAPAAYLRAFKNATVGQLAGLAARGGRAGLWMPSCFAHTSDTCTAAATAVRGALRRGGNGVARARRPRGAAVLLDDCAADGADPDVAVQPRAAARGRVRWRVRSRMVVFTGGARPRAVTSRALPSSREKPYGSGSRVLAPARRRGDLVREAVALVAQPLARVGHAVLDRRAAG